MTKVVTIGGEVIPVDVEFTAWVRMFNEAVDKNAPIIQVETAAGAPCVITARNVAYAVAHED